MSDALPIDPVLPQLTAVLGASGAAVLVAPPGAGKTTRVPLVLADEPWVRGRKIIVLEPRRLAARAAAMRMASVIGQPVGARVGYRVRFAAKVSASTQIEVMTGGVFTRRLLDDPTLAGVAAVLFDEFHERSLDADLGLALTLDVQRGLREDLKLVVMSATIEGGPVSSLLGQTAGGAPVIESIGRSFPVETRYVGRDPRLPIERQVADACVRALHEETGSILVFLPGAAEIRRTERLLHERAGDDGVEILPLHGALDAEAQERAIAPVPTSRRKVVLATSIAETSLTIEGVRIVIDCGLARVPRYEADVGLTRLETVRVSRAAADQRRGRAGRTEPGVCYRLWDAAQTASLEPAPRPEILTSDLSGLVLDLAYWGVNDPSSLRFLDPPPAGALAEARRLLADLGALDCDGQITEEGKRLRRLPLPPRLARMVAVAGAMGALELAAQMAMILTERGLGGNDIDLAQRLDVLRRDRSPRAHDARAMTKGWKEIVGEERRTEMQSVSPGALLALAYPDRVAKNRGSGAAFLLANGRGGSIDPRSPLAREPFLAVAEIAGTAAQGRLALAAQLSLREIEHHLAESIGSRDDIAFDPASSSLRARRLRRLGQIVLSEQPLKLEANEGTARVLSDAIVRNGLDRLPWSKALRHWRARVMFLRRYIGASSSDAGTTAVDQSWPDLSDDALAVRADDWLTPALAGKTSLSELGTGELTQAIQGLLPRYLHMSLDIEAPAYFRAPSGANVPIDYEIEGYPTLAIRVQELFGLDRHPMVAAGRIPLTIELLSPANRPVQVTRDLPGFWRGSYAAVRAAMRGRYPRHAWPDDPLLAAPIRRVARRAQ